jgi:hypothetical protein
VYYMWFGGNHYESWGGAGEYFHFLEDLTLTLFDRCREHVRQRRLVAQ